MEPILNAISQGWSFIGGGVLVVANGIGSVATQLGEGTVTAIKTVFLLTSGS